MCRTDIFKKCVSAEYTTWKRWTDVQRINACYQTVLTCEDNRHLPTSPTLFQMFQQSVVGCTKSKWNLEGGNRCLDLMSKLREWIISVVAGISRRCLRRPAVIDNSHDSTLPAGDGRKSRKDGRRKRRRGLMTQMIITECLIPEIGAEELSSQSQTRPFINHRSEFHNNLNGRICIFCKAQFNYYCIFRM